MSRCTRWRFSAAMRAHATCSAISSASKQFNGPSRVLLNCPVDEWPAWLVKIHVVAGAHELDPSATVATSQTVSSDEKSAAVSRLAALTYGLLGGDPKNFIPLAKLNWETTSVLRRGLSVNHGFSSATDFYQALNRARSPGSGPPAACRAAGRILDTGDAADASSGQGRRRIVIARQGGPTPMVAGLGGNSGGCAPWRCWDGLEVSPSPERKRPLKRRFCLHRGVLRKAQRSRRRSPESLGRTRLI